MGLAQELYEKAQEIAIGISDNTLEVSNGFTISTQHAADGNTMSVTATIPVIEALESGKTTYAADDTSVTAVTPK